MSNHLDLDQGWHSVGPDLGPNCLQRLSTEENVDDSKERVKVYGHQHASRSGTWYIEHKKTISFCANIKGSEYHVHPQWHSLLPVVHSPICTITPLAAFINYLLISIAEQAGLSLTGMHLQLYKSYLFVIIHSYTKILLNGSKLPQGSAVAQWLSAWLKTVGLRVQAWRRHYVEQDTLILT